MCDIDSIDIDEWETYISDNPDLKKKGIKTKEKAIKHWRKFGYYEGRKFGKVVSGYKQLTESEKKYLKNYPDIEKSGKWKRKPYQHYYEFGQYEGRKWEGDIPKGSPIPLGMPDKISLDEEGDDIGEIKEKFFNLLDSILKENSDQIT